MISEELRKTVSEICNQLSEKLDEAAIRLEIGSTGRTIINLNSEQHTILVWALREYWDKVDNPKAVLTAEWIKHTCGSGKPDTTFYTCSNCQTCGSPQWKRCTICEAKMKLTQSMEV